MDIRFECEQCGSRFRVAEKMAGKKANCTKCGTELTVPDISDASSLASEVVDSKIQKTGGDQVAKDQLTDVGSKAGDSKISGSKPSAPKEDMIVFLCPNGHELHGPARLQGKPGACPHCGAKFQIPDYDEDEEDEAGVFPTEDFPMLEGSGTGSGIPDFPSDLPPEPLAVDELPMGESFGFGGGPHPLKATFLWLWKQRGNMGTLEVHMRDNPDVIHVGMYAAEKSQGGCAVFAMEESDGSFTLASVPWENISHVVLRKIEDLDDDAFDEEGDLD